MRGPHGSRRKRSNNASISSRRRVNERSFRLGWCSFSRLLGQGYGQGSQVQLRFLKVRWSDFIFAAMAHEFGFIGVVIMMLLELFVIYRCLRAARLAMDTYGALICFGVATLLAFQGLVNIGVNLRLLPATGLPLPFLSYGGSSLLSLLLGVGLVESVMLRHKSLEFSAG